MALILHQKAQNSHKKRSKEWKAKVETFYLPLDANTMEMLDLQAFPPSKPLQGMLQKNTLFASHGHLAC